MTNERIRVIVEEMDAAGWVLREDYCDGIYIPFDNCETNEYMVFRTWEEVDLWLDDLFGKDRMKRGIGDAERDAIQRVINVLEYVYNNQKVLPEDKLQLAFCLDTLIDLIKEGDE